MLINAQSQRFILFVVLLPFKMYSQIVRLLHYTCTVLSLNKTAEWYFKWPIQVQLKFIFLNFLHRCIIICTMPYVFGSVDKHGLARLHTRHSANTYLCNHPGCVEMNYCRDYLALPSNVHLAYRCLRTMLKSVEQHHCLS